MTKQDVIQQVSKRTDLVTLISRLVIEFFFDVVREALTKGEPIYILTFGSFQVKQRVPKVGRNIR